MIGLKQETRVWRTEVLSAFDPESGCYSHELPRRYSNFIDGMAWVGVMCGCALKVGDIELAAACRRYLVTLIEVGADARNYAPMEREGWKPSTTIPGYWYKEKPQSFAGPAGLAFANQCGADIELVWVPDIMSTAKMYVSLGWVFGYACRWVSALRQHVNSIMLAHLVAGQRPASSLSFLNYDNPFYSAISGVSRETDYATPLREWSEEKTVDGSGLVPMRDRKPNAWIFRNWPYTRYTGSGTLSSWYYTPTACLCGAYLQAATFGKDIA